MKKAYIQSLTLLIALLISSLSYAQNSKTQLDEAKETTIGFMKAEGVKALENNLVKALGAERNSGAVTAAMKKFWKSAKGLDKQQATKLFQRFSNASKSSLKKIASLSPSQLSSYAREVTSNVKLDAKTLKQIIFGAGDKAGNAALRTLSEMDKLIAETGTVSQELLRKLRDEASGLDPKRARALYDLFKKDVADIKNLKDTKNGLGKYVGTVVDGVFVLSDAYDIYYSDDEPEVKAIKATGKIVDYGLSTGAGVATAALGAGELAFGAGLGVGLTIAFTANRVSTLYTEIMMLQKEREAAKDAVKNERIDNGILVRRQLVNINNKIKSGQLRNAKHILIKLEQFILNNNIDNEAKLYDLHSELEEKVKTAERNELINKVLNKARHPYRKALTNYTKGVELHLAKIYAAEALTILNKNLRSYPEIGGLTAISKVQQLIKAINEKIANATDLLITGTNLPKRVYAGQFIDIKVFVSGGIPYYTSIGTISGNVSDNEVTMYWEAPLEPGIEHLTLKIRDCMGSIASASVSIEVVARPEEIEEETKEPSQEVVDNSPKGLEGCWVGWGVCGNRDIDCPVFQYFFKIQTETETKYYSITAHVQIGEGRYYIECSDGLCDDKIRKKKIIGDGWKLYKFKYPDIPELSETSDKTYRNLIKGFLEELKDTKDADERYELQRQIDALNDRINEKIWSRIFYETALEWTNENKWQNFNYSTDDDDYNGYSYWWVCPEEVLVEFSNALKAKSGS